MVHKQGARLQIASFAVTKNDQLGVQVVNNAILERRVLNFGNFKFNLRQSKSF